MEKNENGSVVGGQKEMKKCTFFLYLFFFFFFFFLNFLIYLFLNLFLSFNSSCFKKNR